MTAYMPFDTALQFFTIVYLGAAIFLMLVSTVGLAIFETLEADD